MPASTPFNTLTLDLLALAEAVRNLLQIVTEDRPAEHSLADRYEQAAVELVSEVEEAGRAAGQIEEAIGVADYASATAALVRCNAAFNQASQLFETGLNSYDWLADLYCLANDFPREWRGWVESIRASQAQCEMQQTAADFLPCWQGLMQLKNGGASWHVSSIGLQTIRNASS